MNLTDLQEINVRYGTRDWSLVELVDSWAARVLKIYRDAASDLPESDWRAWTAADLVGSLHLRDVIRGGLENVGDDVHVAALDAIDELFRLMTRSDERNIVRSLDDERRDDDAWWWDRRPVKGPIASEIDAID